jgi:hypothetical protein
MHHEIMKHTRVQRHVSARLLELRERWHNHPQWADWRERWIMGFAASVAEAIVWPTYRLRYDLGGATFAFLALAAMLFPGTALLALWRTSATL